jgi:hypothetical protein
MAIHNKQTHSTCIHTLYTNHTYIHTYIYKQYDPNTFAHTQHYCKQLDSFVKNSHVPLSEEMKTMAAQRWADSFQELGYKI